MHRSSDIRAVDFGHRHRKLAADPRVVVAVPIAGNPLSWRTIVGWHPEGPVVRFADELLKLAGNAYRDVIHRRPRYTAFLERHPSFGLDDGTTL